MKNENHNFCPPEELILYKDEWFIKHNGKETSGGMCRIPILFFYSFCCLVSATCRVSQFSKNRNFLAHYHFRQTAFVAESFGRIFGYCQQMLHQVAVSYTSLCETCRLIGVQLRQARDFTRVLRAIARSSLDSLQIASFLY